MAPPTQALVDQLGAAAVECRQLLSEVRGATKDLRSAIRDAEASQRRLKEDFAAWVADQWGQLEAVDMLGKIKESYVKWVDDLGKANEAIEGIQALKARFTRRAIELGVE